MGHDRLKEEVWQANIDLAESGLIVLTWGNASGVDRDQGVMAIKPSGVEYDGLQVEDMVVLDLETGEKVEGDLNPSSDGPTHLAVYRAVPELGGIVHTHSCYATIWAQSRLEIPCLGTTHADHFYGPIPLTRTLSEQEIQEAYEENTGRVIVEHLLNRGVPALHVPAVLVPHHGPFVWGSNAADAVKNAVILEAVAKMAAHTIRLNPDVQMPRNLLNKHFTRKHGPNAYYGQKKG